MTPSRQILARPLEFMSCREKVGTRNSYITLTNDSYDKRALKSSLSHARHTLGCNMHLNGTTSNDGLYNASEVKFSGPWEMHELLLIHTSGNYRQVTSADL
jgi:hypothetical protein